ncbi:copper amine oxidase N-terminal domain-containing protein [Paenibacillus sp. GCM10012307]|uniref:Copper amine oxidase N-terminal domain-containing protein n=1 Tax=Paenibacillus roseus TaxID=2798579 RepID=A0A934MPQ0_9BACL|nr:copper amine oxidase N-terminal domain-containing protein [Paenibacillus roseus]MBJ6361103.1 copper amine oxidase N-terminal domain-containing protein [Paenibacillus roseus]
MKKTLVLLFGVIAFTIISPLSTKANTISNITIKVNSHTINMYEAPAYVDSKTNLTYVPLRFVSEALGAEIEYVNSKTPITTTIDKPKRNEVKVMIDSKKVEVNGKVENYPGAAVLKNGRTMVPLRVISEGLGAKVKWTPNKGGGGTVEINTPWETPVPDLTVKWNPTKEQKEYATQIFKSIRFDIKNNNLKINVPSVKNKAVGAGIIVNGSPAQKLTLNKLYEYKDIKGLQLNITVRGEVDGDPVMFDSYRIFSKDVATNYIKQDRVPETEDLIVLDMEGNVVPFAAILRALGFN